ncbi:MAG: hypothetical protein ACYDD1_06640 [Caulobacteraceae bacterium]
MKLLLASALAASLLATSSLAQPPADAPAQPHADVPANDGPYAGASPKGFYDVNQRIDHLQAALAGTPHADQALTELNAIRSDLQFRIKRQNGVLRDYDRELITEKLDGFVAKHPALKAS